MKQLKDGEFKVGMISGNVDACYAMGKEAFLGAHPGADGEEAWKEIEKRKKKEKPDKA